VTNTNTTTQTLDAGLFAHGDHLSPLEPSAAWVVEVAPLLLLGSAKITPSPSAVYFLSRRGASNSRNAQPRRSPTNSNRMPRLGRAIPREPSGDVAS